MMMSGTVGVPSLAAVEWRPWELAGRREYGHTETVSIIRRLLPSEFLASHMTVSQISVTLAICKFDAPANGCRWCNLCFDNFEMYGLFEEMAVVVDLKPVPCGNTCHFPIWELLCSFPSCLVVVAFNILCTLPLLLTYLLFSGLALCNYVLTPHSLALKLLTPTNVTPLI
jgi:hypothetical protein